MLRSEILCAFFFFPTQAVLWNTDTLKPKSTLEEHTCLITDVRFSPNMSRFATSSFDKTVRVWDADSVSRHFSFLLKIVDFWANHVFFYSCMMLTCLNPVKFSSKTFCACSCYCHFKFLSSG